MHQKFALILFLITTLHLLLLPAVSFLPGETFVRPFAGKTGMLIRNIWLEFLVHRRLLEFGWFISVFPQHRNLVILGVFQEGGSLWFQRGLRRVPLPGRSGLVTNGNLKTLVFPFWKILVILQTHVLGTLGLTTTQPFWTPALQVTYSLPFPILLHFPNCLNCKPAFVHTMVD